MRSWPRFLTLGLNCKPVPSDRNHAGVQVSPREIRPDPTTRGPEAPENHVRFSFWPEAQLGTLEDCVQEVEQKIGRAPMQIPFTVHFFPDQQGQYVVADGICATLPGSTTGQPYEAHKTDVGRAFLSDGVNSFFPDDLIQAAREVCALRQSPEPHTDNRMAPIIWLKNWQGHVGVGPGELSIKSDGEWGLGAWALGPKLGPQPGGIRCPASVIYQ